MKAQERSNVLQRSLPITYLFLRTLDVNFMKELGSAVRDVVSPNFTALASGFGWFSIFETGTHSGNRKGNHDNL